MMTFTRFRGVASFVVAVFAVVAFGCSQTKTDDPKAAKKDQPSTKKEEKKGAHNYKGRDWCPEHGMPESICTQCQPKVAAERKKAGDWCEKHDRAKSQCFICDPKLKEKFAADYKAKYGEDPPPTEDDEKPAKDKK